MKNYAKISTSGVNEKLSVLIKNVYLNMRNRVRLRYIYIYIFIIDIAKCYIKI